MTLGIVLSVLFAALLHAGWNAFLKKGGDPVLDGALLSLGWVVIVLPLLFIFPLPDPASWPYIGVSVLVHLIYFTFLVNAYRFGDLSEVYTIIRGTPPLLVAFGGILFAGENLSPQGWAGLLLMVGGIIFLGVKGKIPGKPLILALSTAVAIASYTVIDALGVRLSGNVISFLMWQGLFQATLFVLGTLYFKRGALLRHGRRHWQKGLIMGFISLGGYAIILNAMTQAPMAYVSALRETSVIFAALIGVLFLSETMGRHRIISAIIVFAGIVTLRFV